jgi:hypothetical protein
MNKAGFVGSGNQSGGSSSSGTDLNTGGSWYQALATAWGNALDRQASTIEDYSERVNGGDDKPGTIAQLTAEAHKMSFLANSESSSVGAVGQALETMARKQ